MIEIKVDGKTYEVYGKNEDSSNKNPHIIDKETGEVPQNQKAILCDYLISIGKLESKIKLNTHGYVYEVLNSKINKELEKAKEYMLSPILDEEGNSVKDQNGIELVELSLDNVSKVEAMIQNDSAYLKASDEKSEPKGKYIGSTAYWVIQKLKPVLLDNITVSDDEYKETLGHIIKSVDRENSTHLNADKYGRDQILERLLKIKKSDFVYFLKEPINSNFKLIDIIAEKTVVPISDIKHHSRTNVSFASKFCHYACFYLFEGKPEQDNYSIYDNIVKQAIPKYLNYYKLHESKKINLDDYRIYYKTIDEIIKISKSGISRNGFDHLLWYYYKGRL